MDIVSPVQFKKLDFDKFEGGSITMNNSTSSDNKDITEVTTNSQDSSLIDMLSTSFLIFYDKFSKNLIQFKQNLIKIFNKNATNLKKAFALQLDQSKINMSCVDKHLRYMIVLIDFKMILVINLKTEKVSDILHYDFSSILGMFFITPSSTFLQHDELKFCLVFVNKIVYFKITFTPNESINEIKTIKMGFSCVNFYYNTRYLILALQKQDGNSFEFYNLCSDKYLNKNHSFNVLLKGYKKQHSLNNGTQTLGNFSRLFSIFGGDKNLNKSDGSLFGDVKKLNLYKKTQFFLETL
jgi:hypothetical protein